MANKLLFSIALLFLSLAGHAQYSPEYREWIGKAMNFYEAKRYRQSAEAFTQAFASNGGTGSTIDRYNAACAWSRAGVKDSAFFQLNRIATKVNYADYDQLTTDADLENLRNDKRWKELCKLVKKNKEKAEAHFNKPLVAILDTIFHNDQDGRQKIAEVQDKYGNSSKEMTDLWKTIEENDSVDLIKVEKILDKYGWLGADVVGGRGNSTLFLVIQHADIKVQEKYLPSMRAAVKNKKAVAGDLALLEDRVAMRHGGKQIYGSQILNDAEGSFLSPLEDPDHVDKRRAGVGLGTMAEYLQYFHMTWNVEEYKKQLPDLEKRLKKMNPE
jgi:uncharacterized protein DUF6624